MKDSGDLSTTGLPWFNPSDWKRFEFLIRQVIWLTPRQRLTPYQCSTIRRQSTPFLVSAIDVRIAPDICDSRQDRMLRLILVEDASRRVCVPTTMMIEEGSAEDIFSPSDLFSIDLVGKFAKKAVIGRP